MSLDESVIGWEIHWMKKFLDECSLDETAFGWNGQNWMKVFWMKVSVDEIVFGWKCVLPEEETEWQEQGAREAALKLAKSVFKLKEHERATFFSPSENRCINSWTWGTRICCRLRSVNAHDQQKGLEWCWMDTLTKSCCPTIAITANGEVQTHEEATVCVKKLDIFLTMKVLENTPALLSLGKLCDENGYSHEWINGQKPHPIKNGIRIPCNTENFVPIVVPGLSSSSFGSDPSISRTPSGQESHCSTSSSISSSSPTVSEIQTREREDQNESDISPVPVSTTVDERSGRPDDNQANKNPKTNKKESKRKQSNPLCSEIPEWLQEFREILVDGEIPVHGDSHASSSHEASLEPTTKRREDLGKHSVCTHFPKDRNCEIYKRTKITRAPCRRRNGGAVPRAANFGDLITTDHKVLSDNCESRNNHRCAVVVQDLATQWIQAYPCKDKTSQETQRSLQKFLEPERKPKVIYTHNSLEFGKACEDLSWNHCTSTPHRSETNGIAERSVRRVKGKHICCIVAFGSKWKLVGRFYGMLHLSAKRHRFIIWWEDALWKAFLENHLKDRLFHLVHWLSITL